MLNKSRAIIFLLSDVLILLVVLSLTSLILFYTGHEVPMSGAEKGIYYVFSSLLLLLFYIEGLYTLETFDPKAQPVSLVRASAMALTLSVSVLALLYRVVNIQYPMFLFINALTLPYLFYKARLKILSYLSQDSNSQSIILVGGEETLRLTQSEVNSRPYLGYRIRNLFTPDQLELEILPSGAIIAIERALLDRPLLKNKILKDAAEVVDITGITERVSGKIPLGSINADWINEHSSRKNSRSYGLLKSLLDRFVALLMIVALIPLAIVLFPFLLVLNGRPIFFKQTRSGLGNRPFALYKLRTMVVDAEKGSGARWSCPGDSRITPMGKWLRKTRLDELPQLFNILKGDMSLVGPRPERPEIIVKDLAPNIPHYNLRHLVLPGVTGWAQVTFRYGFTTEDSKEKLQYDLYYIKNRGIWMDIIIIIKTIKTVFTAAGH